MHEHYVMFKLKEEYKKDLDQVVAMLRKLPKEVPLIRKSQVFLNDYKGPHSYDVMLYASFDSTDAFKAYMVHPNHIPVQKFIEQRVILDLIADLDFTK